MTKANPNLSKASLDWKTDRQSNQTKHRLSNHENIITYLYTQIDRQTIKQRPTAEKHTKYTLSNRTGQQTKRQTDIPSIYNYYYYYYTSPCPSDKTTRISFTLACLTPHKQGKSIIRWNPAYFTSYGFLMTSR